MHTEMQARKQEALRAMQQVLKDLQQAATAVKRIHPLAQGTVAFESLKRLEQDTNKVMGLVAALKLS